MNLSFFCLYLIILGSLQIYFVGSVQRAPVVLAYVIYTFLFSLFVISLFLYHTFLTLTNSTTLQNLKHNFRFYHNRSYFSKNSKWKNCTRRICYKLSSFQSHILTKAEIYKRSVSVTAKSPSSPISQKTPPPYNGVELSMKIMSRTEQQNPTREQTGNEDSLNSWKVPSISESKTGIAALKQTAKMQVLYQKEQAAQNLEMSIQENNRAKDINNWVKSLKEHRRGKSNGDQYPVDFQQKNGNFGVDLLDQQQMFSVDDGDGIIFAGSQSSRNNNTFYSEGQISYYKPRYPRLRSVTQQPIPEVMEKGSIFYENILRSRQNSEPRWKNPQFSSRSKERKGKHKTLINYIKGKKNSEGKKSARGLKEESQIQTYRDENRAPTRRKFTTPTRQVSPRSIFDSDFHLEKKSEENREDTSIMSIQEEGVKLESMMGRQKLQFKNAMIHYPLSSKNKNSVKQGQSYVTSKVKSLYKPEGLFFMKSDQGVVNGEKRGSPERKYSEKRRE